MKYLIILLVCASCGSVSYHTKRAAHHIEKAKQKGAIINRDTLWHDLLLKTAPVKVEFIPKALKASTDTVYFSRAWPGSAEPVTVRVIVKRDTVYKADTVYAYLEVPASDTTVRVPVEAITEVKPPDKRFNWFAVGFGCGVLTVAVLLWTARRKRN